MKRVKIPLSDGTFYYKQIYSKKLYKNYRIEALKNRTPAELKAEAILLQHFKSDQFIAEYIFLFRRFDFFFPLENCAVEIDGSSHDNKKELDYSIDKYLYLKYKIIIFRCKNFNDSELLNIIRQIKIISQHKTLMPKKKKEKKLKRALKKTSKVEKCSEFKKPTVSKFILRKAKQ